MGTFYTFLWFSAGVLKNPINPRHKTGQMHLTAIANNYYSNFDFFLALFDKQIYSIKENFQNFMKGG